MFISQVTIRHFKSFGSEFVTFQDTFVSIVGPNGSGKSNLLDAICFALGVETKRLRISNYSELIPGDKILEKILPYVQVVLVKGNPGGVAQKITVESQLIRLSSNSFSVRHQLNGRLITKQELIRQLLSHGLNVKEPVFILQQSTAPLDLLRGGPYLLELCKMAAGVKSCFDGVDFAKEKLGEWQKSCDEISGNIEKLKANLEKHTTHQKESYRLQELLDRINALEKKARRLGIKNDTIRLETIDLEISRLSECERHLLASLGLFLERKVDIENELLELKEKTKSNAHELENQIDKCRDFENSKSLADENLQKHEHQIAEMTGEKERMEVAIKQNTTQLILRTKAQNILLQNIEHTQSLIDLFSCDQGSQLQKDHLGWLTLKIEEFNFEEQLMNRSLDSREEPHNPEEISLSITQTEQEIATKQASIEKLQRQIRPKEEKSHQEKIRVLKEMESSIVSEINAANEKLSMAEGKEKRRLVAFDVFKFLPRAKSYLPALATIITGKNSQIVESSLEANSIARDSNSPFWILDRLQDVPVNRQRQQKIQSQYPVDDIVLPQDLISFDPKYQKVVNRLFGPWLICKTQIIAEKVLAKFHERSVACDTLSLISKGSMTGGFRQFGGSDLRDKFSRDSATQQLKTLNERYSTCRAQKRVLVEEMEELKAQRQSLEEERRELRCLLHKKKIQNEALEECSRSKSLLKSEIEARMEFVRTKRAEFEDQKNIVLNLSRDAMKSHLDDQKAFLDHQLFSVGEEIVQTESRISFATRKKESFEVSADELDQNKSLKSLVQFASASLQTEVDYLNALSLKQKELKERVRIVEEQFSKEKLKENELSNQLLATRGEREPLRKESETLRLKIDEIGDEVIGDWESSEDIEEEIRELKVEWELLDEKHSRRKMEKDKVVTRNLIDQMEEIERHRVQMTESIEKLRSGLKSAEEIAQKNLEETFLELQDTVGKMYHSLVPSKRVKLEKCGKRVQDGIEVKVANFNGETTTWQSDRNFLSGGQQALLAITITLAALCSSKAPIQFLILDEVDAAMDEQNSQAVAKLLSTSLLRNCQVLSISHHASFFKEAKQLVSVGKKGGSSVIIANNTRN